MTDISRESKSLRLRWIISLLGVAACIGVFLRVTYKTWPNAVELAEKAGRTVKFLEPFQQIFFWTAVVNLVLLLLLAATARWWVKAEAPGAEQVPWAKPSRIVWAMLLVLMAGALALRVPRLGMSLYNDESHNYARYFSGTWKLDGIYDETPTFRATPWIESLTRNMAGNNSQLFTTLARASLELWTSVFGGARGEIIEVPVRLPSLIAGMISILLFGALMWKWRGATGLLWLMAVMVVHAWLVRFQTEARSYAVMLLGVALLFWFLDSALRTGRWRDWLGFGFGVLICAWAFLGSAYFLVAVFLALMIRQVVCWRQGTVSFQQVLRPLFAGLFAAMLGAQLFLGMIPPILYQLENFQSIKGTMGGQWWGDVLSHLVYGSRWWDGDVPNPSNFSMVRLLEGSPWLWASVIGAAAVTAAGWCMLVRKGGAAMVLAISAPLALLIAWAAMSRKGNYLLYWYMIYAVPGFAFSLAYGLSNLTDGLRQTLRSLPFSKPIGVAMGLFILVPQILCGMHWSNHAKQDERGPVEIVRGARYPHYKGTEGEKALFIAFWSNTPNYDPMCGILANAGHLEEMIAKAGAEKRPLYVTYSHSGYAEREHVAVMTKLKNPAEFERVAVLYGQEEEQYTHYLYRWLGQK